ncbi:hypothetical protein PRNP1_015043 [Phytophthora ramorum]
MKSVRSVVDALPPLKLNDSEETELQNLSENFVLANIEDYLEIGEDVRKTGNTPREWRELRRKDGIRVYTQRSKKGDSGAAGLTVPSLLLFGTIQGALNDVMYAVSASNDEDIKKTVCTVRPWENTAILEKKLPVCGPCIQDILKGSALEVARDEVHLRVYTRDSDWWSTSE